MCPEHALAAEIAFVVSVLHAFHPWVFYLEYSRGSLSIKMLVKAKIHDVFSCEGQNY